MDWNAANGQGQDQMFGGGFGFNGAQAGFPGMDWNNPEFAQMMQMQMQNGTWGGFPNMMGKHQLINYFTTHTNGHK